MVQHDARRPDRHRLLGTHPDSGAPVELEAEFLDQDLRLTLGLVEPHFFAGFSGGPKMVAPGLASLETILDLHSPARVADPQADLGGDRRQPGARRHPPRRRAGRGAPLGRGHPEPPPRDHRGARRRPGHRPTGRGALAVAGRGDAPGGQAPYDIVVTTNGGYPLDQNLYQTVKGMSAAAQIVKPGGAILVAAECSDGFPGHGALPGDPGRLPGAGRSSWRRCPAWRRPPTSGRCWCRPRSRREARVLLHTGGLTDDEVREAWLEPVGRRHRGPRSPAAGGGPGSAGGRPPRRAARHPLPGRPGVGPHGAQPPGRISAAGLPWPNPPRWPQVPAA